MTPPTATRLAATPFTPAPWPALRTLRCRYWWDRDLFSGREVAHLRFLRWLYQAASDRRHQDMLARHQDMQASVTQERTKEGRRMVTMTRSPGALRRLGIVMAPQSDDAREAGGVLNPAVARGPDGQLYLLPRLVATGNYSRIGLARVRFDRRGDPVGVERLGVVLEPQAPYERNTRTGGGVEDPRVTYLAARGLYVMTYTAFGQAGPRIAAAVSRDLVRWHRTGLVRFAPLRGLDLEAQDNKDALLFPEPVPAPDGRPALALIHRPTFRVAPALSARALLGLPSRPSMWLSYAPLDEIVAGRQVVFGQHHVLAGP